MIRFHYLNSFSNQMKDEPDEVIEAYVEAYDLNDDEVPVGHRRKAIRLICDLRLLNRKGMIDPPLRERSIQALDRRIREHTVFNHLEHEGHQRLLRYLSETISRLSRG
jgi:hypothetical protein